MESVSRTSNIPLKGKWQSKANSDSVSKAEESQWEFYSPEYNYLLEKAYYEKKIEVDFGDSVVSLQQMRQNKKGNIILQTPIRRITYEDNEMDIRSARYFETELPKTINKIFGDLGHFISFFSRRNPEILSFTKQFEEFEQSNDLNGFNKNILPQLIHCLEEELLKPIEDQLKDHSLSELQKKIKQKSKRCHEELISLFKKDFASFEELYGLLLKSYTMNTSLYLKMNKYLRDESWTALDNLLPYAICLCKAFFSFQRGNNSQKETQLQAKENSKILYRGTALDKFALKSYQMKEVSKFFSWYSVTSTSRNRGIAEKFMYESVDMEKKKFPVLFVIEIPLVNEVIDSEYLKWIDIHQYSAIPNEDEVILAPGSAFELVNLSTDEEERTTIHMKLKLEIESLAHQGLIMQGAFQNEMMIDKQVMIMCLEGEELYEALKSLSGNRLVEEIEFCLCIFDRRSLEEMLLTLTTLEKARGLKLISCKYEDKQEISSVKLADTRGHKIEEIEIYEVQHIFEVLSLNNQNENLWATLRIVNIHFRNLNPGFDYWRFRAFKFSTGLTSLTLDFSGCDKIIDEGVEILASQALKHLTQLTSLTLDFSWCHQITDEGVKSLASQALKHLTQLTSFTLDFSRCYQITDEGVKSLASQALKHLTQLTSLTLNFSHFGQITDEGMRNLGSQLPQYLTQLTSFIFNSREIKQKCQDHQRREDQGPRNEWFCLNLTRPKTFTQLTFSGNDPLKSTRFSQNKNFQGPATSSQSCTERERALNRLLLKLIKPEWGKVFECEQITDKTVNNLEFQILKLSIGLASLTLKFFGSNQITDEGVKSLASQGLKHLTELTSLTLNFSQCNQITDEGMKSLASEALKHLTQLTSFTLDFSRCYQITDEGVKSLASQALKHLTQLTSLTLDFSRCEQITDEGMNNLVYHTIKHSTQLTALTLDFSSCKITEITALSIAKMLRYSGFIPHQDQHDKEA